MNIDNYFSIINMNIDKWEIRRHSKWKYYKFDEFILAAMNVGRHWLIEEQGQRTVDLVSANK